MRFPFPALAALSLLSLAGCATISFKPGASSSSMSADEQSCRKQNPDEAAYVACMRERGWYIAGKESNEAKAEEKKEADEEPEPAASPTPTSRREVAPAPVATVPLSASPTVQPTTAEAPRVPAAAAPEPAVTRPPETAVPEAAATPDPLTLVHVTSWWKFGAGPGDLAPAIDACVAKLGPEHRPNAAATEVTVALRQCMRDQWWFSK